MFLTKIALKVKFFMKQNDWFSVPLKVEIYVFLLTVKQGQEKPTLFMELNLHQA